MEETKTVWIVMEEYDPYLDNHVSYFIHSVFDTKEKADEWVKELAEEDAKEYDVTPTIEYRDGDMGYEVLGSYYFVKEMEVKQPKTCRLELMGEF